MKNYIYFLFPLFLLTSALYAEKIKIGISVPLTGGAASYGTDIKNALIFANKRIANNAYELIIEDDHCLDKMAVTIAKKLTSIDKVNYMLGFGCSGTVLASAPVYNNAKVVVIASGTGAPKITYAGDYIFRTKPSLNIAGKVIFKDMKLKFKTVGIVTEETAYCQGLTEAVVKSNTDKSVKIINENFLSNKADVRAILIKLKSKGVQALFLNTQVEDALVTIYKQALALNMDVQVYGTFHPGSVSFLKALGEKANGILYADTPFNSQMLNKKGLKIFDEFIKEYGKPLASEHFASLSYVAFSTLHDAIKSGENVKDYLYKTNFKNIIDTYSFDKNGDIVSEKVTYVLKEIRNSKPSPYLFK